MIFVSCGCTALSPTRARNVDAKKSKDVVSCELPALGSFLSTPSNSDLGRVRKWQNVFARKDAKGMFDADRGVASFLTSRSARRMHSRRCPLTQMPVRSPSSKTPMVRLTMDVSLEKP